MADSKFNNSYYTRPSTAPNYGAAIGSALQNFLAQRQEAQKMAILQQQLANETQKVGWENPYRTPSDLDRLKASSNPYNTMAMIAAMQGGQTPQPITTPPILQSNQPQIPTTPFPNQWSMAPNQSPTGGAPLTTEGTQFNDINSKMQMMVDALRKKGFNLK